MSLRLFLIGLIAMILAASLLLGGALAVFNASRSVETEMRSALAVAGQMIETSVARLGNSDDPRRDLESLVGSFKGNRHLRVVLAGDDAAVADPAVESAPLGEVPGWFVGLLAVPSASLRIPAIVRGETYGTVVLASDPHNEILETWDEFGNGLLVLALFSAPTVLLVYFFIGRALRPLDRLAAALSSIGRGDYGTRLGGKFPPELSRLRDSFNRMAGQLAEMAGENRRLNEQLLTLQEEERSQIARELHDEIGPFLFAINVDAANIARNVEAGRLAPVKTYVQSIAEAVAHMQQQVRSMLRQLRPIGLTEFGLTDAIENLIEFWRRRYPEISYEFRAAAGTEGFGEMLDPTIYRVVQESLSNAVRHGKPAMIAVTLEIAAAGAGEGGRIVVRITDDGQGMGESSGVGYGILGMTERVKALGGDLAISNRPGEGLAVTATLPYPPEEAPGSFAKAVGS